MPFPARESDDYEVVIAGRFSADDLVTTWTPTPGRKTTPAIEAAIADAWREAQREAERHGRVLFAGPLCRLDRLRVEGARLLLDFSLTDYRDYLGTNVNRPVIRTLWAGDDAPVLSNATGVCAAVRTADGLLLIGRRSERTMEYAGWWHVPGGHIDPRVHVADGRVDVFAAAVDEVVEETGVRRDEIVSVVCTGIVRPVFSNKPEPTFLVDVQCTGAELLTRRGNDEHSEWRLLREGEAVQNIVPPARGCLVLARR